MSRFSRTVIREKTRRPSGASATPIAATLCAGWLLMRRSNKDTVPRRGWSKPEIVFRVVLLPAPLEPIRVTISPWLTWSEIPLRAWMCP
jgi:hypothetical protein